MNEEFQVSQEELRTINERLTATSEQLTIKNQELGRLNAELEERVEERTEEIRQASLYARSLIEASLDPLVTISHQGKITDVNKATEEATGLPRERLVGSDFSNYFTEPENARKGYQQVLAVGFTTDYPLTIRGKDGRSTDALYNATVYRDSAGRVLGVFAAARDVTKQKRIATELSVYREHLEELVEEKTKRLWESEQKTRKLLEDVQQEKDRLLALVNSIVDEVWFADKQGRYTLANPVGMREFADKNGFLERDVEKLVGSLEILRPDGSPRPVEESPSLRALKGEIVRNEETLIRTPLRGELRYHELSATPVRDVKGEIIGSVTVSRDITERKKAEQELARDLDAMARLRKLGMLFVQEDNLEPLLTEIVDAAIAITGADFGNIQLIDPKSGDLRIAAQRGFPQWWLEFWNSVSKGRGSCGTALQRGERVMVEDVEKSPIFVDTPALDIQRKAGVRAVQSTPLISRSGEPLGMFSTHYRTPHRPDDRALQLLDLLARQAADMIERARAEEAMRRSREQLRSLAENAPGVLQRFDRHLRVVYLSPAAERFTGIPSEKFIGKTNREVGMPEHLCVLWEKGMNEVFATGSSRDVEFAMDTPEGPKSFLLRLAPEHGPDGKHVEYVLGVSSDVSERKKAEDELRASEERFRAFVTASSEVVYRMSPDWKEMRNLHGRDFIPDTEEPSRSWLEIYLSRGSAAGTSSD